MNRGFFIFLFYPCKTETSVRMKLCTSVLFTLLFVTICESVYAQSFHGLIINSEQKTTISGALVYLVELDAATVSNSEGVFTIDHYPKKVVHIQISAEGYSTINEDLDLSKIDEKVFSLEPSHVDLQEVVVSVPNGKLARENIMSIERLKLQD